MIIGLVFSFLFPIVTYVCSGTSLGMSISKRKVYKTKYAIFLNSIALVIAIIVHVITTIAIMSAMKLK